jgi:hypothetical protein
VRESGLTADALKRLILTTPWEVTDTHSEGRCGQVGGRLPRHTSVTLAVSADGTFEVSGASQPERTASSSARALRPSAFSPHHSIRFT